ncbi:MAG: hypothetical protein DMG69_03745 [Acidobacteria bacterium]|nr:MAG: hypothetical protein DMG69_03745 [Acidobacteriota bacterium]
MIGGSILMALGAVVIALSSATGREHCCWQDAAEREGERYAIQDGYVRASMEGRKFEHTRNRRSLVDWLLVGGATAIFVARAAVSRSLRCP